jgi:hypothetical protein
VDEELLRHEIGSLGDAVSELGVLIKIEIVDPDIDTIR